MPPYYHLTPTGPGGRIILRVMLGSFSELADAASMQTALNLSRNGARGNIDVIFISAFPDAPHRRSSAALVTDGEPHDKFTLSAAHTVTVSKSSTC